MCCGSLFINAVRDFYKKVVGLTTYYLATSENGIKYQSIRITLRSSLS